MKHAIKYTNATNPIYTHLKRHFCPHCGAKVAVKYISKLVNSKSQNASQYDFSIGDTFLIGNVEFRTTIFHCASCNLNIPISEMKSYERSRRKNR